MKLFYLTKTNLQDFKKFLEKEGFTDICINKNPYAIWINCEKDSINRGFIIPFYCTVEITKDKKIMYKRGKYV